MISVFSADNFVEWRTTRFYYEPSWLLSPFRFHQVDFVARLLITHCNNNNNNSHVYNPSDKKVSDSRGGKESNNYIIIQSRFHPNPFAHHKSRWENPHALIFFGVIRSMFVAVIWTFFLCFWPFLFVHINLVVELFETESVLCLLKIVVNSHFCVYKNCLITARKKELY